MYESGQFADDTTFVYSASNVTDLKNTAETINAKAEYWFLAYITIKTNLRSFLRVSNN